MTEDIQSKYTFHRLGVGGLCILDEKILLVKHKYGPSKDKWLLPGGFVELGEELSTAIEREVLEETGVITQVLDLVLVRHMSRERPAGGIISDVYVVFSLEYKGGEPKPDLIENTDTQFVPISELDKYEISELSKFIIAEKTKKGGFKLLTYKPNIQTMEDSKIITYQTYG